MRYLGIAKIENGRLVMPDSFDARPEGRRFEVVEVAGDFLLTTDPLDRRRLEEVDRLAKASIDEHRSSLEGLSQ